MYSNHLDALFIFYQEKSTKRIFLDDDLIFYLSEGELGKTRFYSFN